MLGKKLTLGALVGLAALCGGLGGCAGEIADDADDHEIDDVDSTTSELTSPEPTGGDQEGDKDCDDKDGDPKKHHNHRHHKFKVLDRLDGTHDHAITIALLPAGLPDRLIAKLQKIDRNGDGIVTKDESKAWKHHKKQKKHDKG